ncbi:MAG: AbrB/MazE/SpoVT family DNA-binding domain-containing protein [Candidatus Micrarchaeota archaeon]
MASISITKMSSKGQIVIPSDMRSGIKEGERFVVIRSGDKFILKSVSDFDENIEDDLLFAERTEKALERYEKGAFKKMSGKDFLKELGKW